MPETTYTRRAKYYRSADGFNIARPAVPAHQFIAERDAACDPRTATGLIPLDLGATLGTGFLATAPLILARYARIRAGEKLATRFLASGELYYVIDGRGETQFGAEAIAWETGDAFSLPGGGATTHVAAGGDALLWVVTNEPELAFERLQPPAPGEAPIEAVHYPAAEIRRELEAIHRLPFDPNLSGKSVSFGSAALERERTCLPSYTFSMNSMAPHESQRAHCHNAVAVTLAVQGTACHSMIGDERIPWQRHAAMVTPPGAVHSHHNEGAELALFLIVQDGGLHYHLRTMGFSY